ncbi:biotin--[acetyl-CoA-carboxylase] ligase [Ekhidna sp. To15]|uniref:biotin--[acetyl-CoA-carboxylase] ligase n=1 Tax=Ekhidna sp. To15 TaxID=3395267 RepID=UPI003F521C85
MHKIFAKPLFLGKKVVFLPQCHSTNDELVQMTRNFNEPEGTLVYTNEQQSGKGQRGNIWTAEPGKNILMSLLLRPKFLPPANQFNLNLITGLAIVDTLKEFLSGNIFLKWPNDVYINEKKIAGVLIENNLRGATLESSVVGIGLNVNQKGFEMSTATSLAMESSKDFEREDILEKLLCNIEKWYLKLKAGKTEEILNDYHDLLMWRGEKRIFKSERGEFEGEIIGIDHLGRLAVEQDGNLKYFGIKEIQFIG